MRLYLAGPMRGYPEFNFPAFVDATAKLRACGHEVFSPAEWDRANGFNPAGMTGHEHVEGVPTMLAKDLDYICRHAEAVVVLPGWSSSAGARAEEATARALGKPVWQLDAVLRGDEGIMDSAIKFLDENMPKLAPGFEHAFGRYFEGGAYRDTDNGKFDYEGFLSPAVLQEFARYMHKHRTQSDGHVRDSDNWQKGIPLDAYMKSMWRHFMDVWTLHRFEEPVDPDVHLEALMALLFNVQGYAFELLRGGAL